MTTGKHDAKSLVGRKLRVCSMVFHIIRYDTRRRRLIMRNTHTHHEHELYPSELFAYLGDTALKAHVRLLEEVS